MPLNLSRKVSPLFLSRIRPAGPGSLAEHAGQGEYGYHQMVWSIFTDHPERQRDFLYRLETSHGQATIYALSQRAPRSAAGWLVESKAFAPDLRAGDRLQFSLRANATRAVATAPGRRGVRHDVVMHEKKLKQVRGEPVHMPSLVQEAGSRWLESRAPELGFELESVAVEAYEQHRFHKPNSGADVRYSTLDFAGVLKVRDMAAFRNTLQSGVGAAKGFGNGLLLVRRAL